MTISKKILMLMSPLILSMLTTSTFAEDYSFLKFTLDSGETYTIATDNLEFVIGDENLTFNNTNLTLPVNSLVSMEFTNDPSGVNEITFDISGKIEVYTVDGLNSGEFDSYSEAIQSLTPGIYVIKDSKGKSLKIRVGK